MRRSVVARSLAIVVLLGALLGLMVWYGTLEPAPGQWVFAGSEELGAEYEAYVGERVLLIGTVTDIDPVRIRLSYGNGKTLHVTVVNLDTTTTPGDRLALYGVAAPDHSIRTINAYTIPSANYVSMYLLSFLAGLWALVRIIRGWRVDPERLALEPRTEPLVPSDVRTTNQHPQEEDTRDA